MMISFSPFRPGLLLKLSIFTGLLTFSNVLSSGNFSGEKHTALHDAVSVCSVQLKYLLSDEVDLLMGETA